VARIPYVDPEAAPERVREVLDALPPLNIFRVLAHAESVFRPGMAYAGAILTSMELDAALRELAILRVARLAEAEYEWVQHVPIARAVGASDDQIAAIERGDVADESLPAGWQAALALVTQLVEQPRPDEAVVARVAEHLPPRQLVELVLAATWYRSLAALMNVVDIDLDAALGGDVLRTAEQRAQQLRGD
jgi:alkylhydroperoxidase family enzyme